jgi:hypothetical protein
MDLEEMLDDVDVVLAILLNEDEAQVGGNAVESAGADEVNARLAGFVAILQLGALQELPIRYAI